MPSLNSLQKSAGKCAKFAQKQEEARKIAMNEMPFINPYFAAFGRYFDETMLDRLVEGLTLVVAER